MFSIFISYNTFINNVASFLCFLRKVRWNTRLLIFFILTFSFSDIVTQKHANVQFCQTDHNTFAWFAFMYSISLCWDRIQWPLPLFSSSVHICMSFNTYICAEWGGKGQAHFRHWWGPVWWGGNVCVVALHWSGPPFKANNNLSNTTDCDLADISGTVSPSKLTFILYHERGHWLWPSDTYLRMSTQKQKYSQCVLTGLTAWEGWWLKTSPLKICCSFLHTTQLFHHSKTMNIM